ncbi:hypothetical protein D3C72_1273500 [compost metagenome]
MTAAGADDALALLDALDRGDEDQARTHLNRLTDRVNVARWPQRPVEPRQENISNAEFFGPEDERKSTDKPSVRAPRYEPNDQERARADSLRASNKRHAAELAEARERLGVN